MTSRQRTFLMVKPDAVQRGLVGTIIKRFEQRGFKIVALKFFLPSQALAKAHYDEHKDKAFFGNLVDFITSGPVCAMVWEGNNIVQNARAMMGATKPENSTPGTVRGDFGIDCGRNCIHGSANEADAQREIALWFKPEELCEWQRTLDKHIYE